MKILGRAFVILLIPLHIASGVVSALAPCCDNMESGLMECCLTGGPDHDCPHMRAMREGASTTPGGMHSSCGAGHDDGVPALGFAGVPPALTYFVAPDRPLPPFVSGDEATAARAIHPPTPPPQI